jgi:hypothetical protein
MGISASSWGGMCKALMGLRSLASKISGRTYKNINFTKRKAYKNKIQGKQFKKRFNPSINQKKKNPKH